MNKKTILALIVAVSLGTLVVSLQPVLAISADFIQTENERQGDYYKIAIKVFDSPGYAFWDHGDYTSNAVVYVHVMGKTLTGKTDKFGNFNSGFWVPRDQAIGAYDVFVVINGHVFNVGQTHVTKFVAQHGSATSGGGGGEED